MLIKGISAFVLIIFTFQNTVYADILTRSSAQKDTLGPPKIFAASVPNESSANFKDSILSDISMVTVALSIADHILIDDNPADSVSRAIRDKFRNNKDFYEGFSLDNVKVEDGVVVIGYSRDNIDYKIQVFPKERIDELRKENSEWAISDNWGIQVVDNDIKWVESVLEIMRANGILLVDRRAVDKNLPSDERSVFFDHMSSSKLRTTVEAMFEPKVLTPEDVALYRKLFPEARTSYHGQRISSRNGKPVLMNMADPEIMELIEDRNSPLYRILETEKPELVSFHIGFSCEKLMLTSSPKTGKTIVSPASPTLSREALMERFAGNINTIKKELAKRGLNPQFIIESFDYQPGGAYEYICEPEFIKELLARTGTKYLFDCAHVFISSRNLPAYRDRDFMEYVRDLLDDIDIVAQMHIAVPVFEKEYGRWRDIHLPLSSAERDPRIDEIIRYIVDLRKAKGLKEPLPVIFETGRGNSDTEIKEFINILEGTDRIPQAPRENPLRSPFMDKDALDALYGYAAPLLLKGRDMDLYHTETVFNFMDEIIRGEGLADTDAKRLLAIALLHDIGYTEEDEADFRSADKRTRHMERGEIEARRILERVNKDIGRAYYSEEDINEICRVIGIHDNPSINKPFGINDRLALLFRPADRIAMLERKQFEKDLARRSQKEKGVNPVENLLHVIRRHTDERRLYPTTAKGFIEGTLYTTPTSYFTFMRLVSERIRDIKSGLYGALSAEELAKLDSIRLDEIEKPPRDMAGSEAPSSDPRVREMIKAGDIVEFSYAEGKIEAYKVKYVEGYRVGKTEPSEYRGEKIDISYLLNDEQQKTLAEWISSHHARGEPVKFRSALQDPSLGWDGDMDHSIIAHAGYRDKMIYNGHALLRYILLKENEELRKEVLDNDEFKHVAHKSFNHKNEAKAYQRRCQMIGSVVKTMEAMRQDDWKYILSELRSGMSQEDPSQLIKLFKICEEAHLAQFTHPVESKYPILRAVTLLNKEEKNKLVDILNKSGLRQDLIIVDTILLMIDKGNRPKDWIIRHVPNMDGRRIWETSSEIWYPAGGLGRVMQYHSIGMAQLGAGIRDVEPLYHPKTDDNGRRTDEANIKHYESFSSGLKDIKEVFRYHVRINNANTGESSIDTHVIVYRGINKYGIECYFLSDTGKNGPENGGEPYYTKILYNYSTAQNPVTWEEFSSFMPMASLILVWQAEKAEREKDPTSWKPPIIHGNDAQLALITIYLDMLLRENPEDEVLKEMHSFFTTHTYPNRQEYGKIEGQKKLEEVMGVHSRYFDYFLKHYNSVIDITSGGIRSAHTRGGWTGGVSAKHVDDEHMYDKWGKWETLQLIGVTNGDERELTAQVFRDILLEKFPDADLEHPTAGQVVAVKREAKKRLGLNPDQYVVSYSGRLVPEKIGRGTEGDRPDDRDRAFHDNNIEELVRMGVQVVIYGNVQDNTQSREIERELKALADKVNNKGYPGKFIFIPKFDPDQQRALFAATDIQINDSDERTEAAGYSECDASSCGALIMAPPWREGILQAQGIPINLDVPGEGNTIIPQGSHYTDYMKALKAVLETEEGRFRKPEDLAEYQATSVRLSRILETILTAAEYLRQFDRAVARAESRRKAVKKHNPYEDAKKVIRKAGAKLGLPEEKIAELEKVGRERVDLFTEVVMDNGSTVRFQIYACLHNGTLGAPKGGISIAESKRVFPDEIRAKSAWMTIKTALVGVGDRGYTIGLGGGKSGIVIPDGMDINKMSSGEVERLARGYTKALFDAGMIGPETYVPAPDIGVDNELGGKIMAWIADEYERLSGRHAPEMVTGKTVKSGSPDGGILGRDEATERGGLYILEALLSHTEALEPHYKALKGFTPTLQGKTVAVQGAGKVGNIANLLDESKAKIVGWSDRNGALYDKGGLPVGKLSSCRKGGDFMRDDPAVKRQKAITNAEMIALPVDILVLAATGGVITENNADSVKAKVILCLANGPITPEAEIILKKRGVLVIPDVLANAGGVTVSFFEMLQNMEKTVWTLERTRSELKNVMNAAFEDVLQIAVSEDVGLTEAAYMTAIRRIISWQQRTELAGEAISLTGLDIPSDEHESLINIPWKRLILEGKVRSLFSGRKGILPGDVNIKQDTDARPFFNDLRALEKRFSKNFDVLIGNDDLGSLPPYLVLHAGNRRHQAYIPRSYMNALSDFYDVLDEEEKPEFIQIIFEAFYHDDMHIRQYESTLGSQGPPVSEKDIDLIAPSFRARALFRMVYAMQKTGVRADPKKLLLALKINQGKKASYLYGYSHLTSAGHLKMASKLLEGKPSRIDIILAQHHLGYIFNNNSVGSKMFKEAVKLLGSNNGIAIDIGPETGKPFPLWKFVRELMKQNALISDMRGLEDMNVKARHVKQFEPWQRGTRKESGDSVYYPAEGETTALPAPVKDVRARIRALKELDDSTKTKIIKGLHPDTRGGTIISREALEIIGGKLLPKCAVARSAAGKGTRDEEVSFDINGNKVRLSIAKAARKVLIDGGKSILEVTVAQLRGINNKYGSAITLDLHTSHFTDRDVRIELERLGFRKTDRGTYVHASPGSPEVHITRIRKTSLFDMHSGDFYRNVKPSLPWGETFWPDAHDTAFIDFIVSGRAYEAVQSGRLYQLVATIENLAFTPDPIPLAIMKLMGVPFANEVILQPEGSIGGTVAKFREEFIPEGYIFGQRRGMLEAMEIDSKLRENMLGTDKEAYFPLFNSASYAGDILEFSKTAFMPGLSDEEVISRLKEFYDARKDPEKLAELRFKLKNEYRQRAQLWEKDKRYPALQPTNMVGSLTWLVPTVFIEVPAGISAGKSSRFEWLKDNNLANLYRDRQFVEFLLTQNSHRIFVKNAVLLAPGTSLKQEAMLRDLKERYDIGKIRLGQLKRLIDSRIILAEGSLERIQDKGIQQYAEIAPERVSAAGAITGKKPAPIPDVLTKSILEDQMEKIHSVDMDALPYLDKNKKTLWHVIPIRLIPPEQRTMFIDLVAEMQREYPEGREKIRIVTEKQDLAGVVRELAADTGNLVDVALDNEGDIDKLPDGVKMLVFKPAGASLGNFRQLEGMIAGLRLLHMKDRAQFEEKMARLYELMTGKPPKEIPDISDPREFARKLIFELPPITVKDTEEFERLDKNLRELLKSA